MGENKKSIFKIGSGEVDIIKNSLPDIKEVKKYYNINFEQYAILIFHPVTTEFNKIKNQVKGSITCCEAFQTKLCNH